MLPPLLNFSSIYIFKQVLIEQKEKHANYPIWIGITAPH